MRGRDCFVVQSTCDPVNDNLMELLIYIDCLRRASARRITAVIPYFGYARQDRKDEGRVPITAKLVANLITAAGADRVLCMDLHAAQIQGFFDIPVDHLSAVAGLRRVLQQPFATSSATSSSSRPDVGNVKVANMYANLLDADLAIIDKRRESGMKVASQEPHRLGSGPHRPHGRRHDLDRRHGLRGRQPGHGRRRATACWPRRTHAVLVGLAMERLSEAPISRVIVTDTIPNGRRLAPIAHKLHRLTVARLLGEAIHRIHHDMSVSALFRRAQEPSDDGTKRTDQRADITKDLAVRRSAACRAARAARCQLIDRSIQGI